MRKFNPHTDQLFDDEGLFAFDAGGMPSGAQPGRGAAVKAGEPEFVAYDMPLSAKGGKKGPPDRPGDGDGGDGGGEEPTVTDSYTSGDPTIDDALEFNVTVDFYGDNWTPELKEDFIEAADLISSVITDDIQDINLFGRMVDDIVIDASLVDIDGEGGILGQAGPTYIRTADSLPVAGQMQFDIADAAYFDELGLWDDIVVHEMLHSVGFGTIWDRLNLVDSHVDDNGTRKRNDDTVDLRFNGEAANQASAVVYPDIHDGLGPVIETDGGSGTAGGHWDEETYGSELMTGYLNWDNTLSQMTIASLEDLGYETTWDDGFIA